MRMVGENGQLQWLIISVDETPNGMILRYYVGSPSEC